MAYTPKFYGIKKSNRFVFKDPESFSVYMQKFKDDTEMEMIVKRKYKKRTTGAPGEDTNFNGYYWGVIVAMVADEIGEADRQQVSDWIQLSIGNVKKMPGGKEVAGSTSEMSGGDFADMCSRVRTWAGTNTKIFGESGFYIPEPHEGDY